MIQLSLDRQHQNPIYIAFLNAMLQGSLESPIVSLQLEDPHLHREHEEDKLSILDISATLDTGTRVNVEIQLNNNHNMIKRSLYYWGRLYTSQLQKGMPYSSLHKTITINLLNFEMFPEYEAFHTTGILWNQQQQKVLSSDIEVHMVEIPKLMQQWRNEQLNPWEDSFVRWLLLLPANEDEHLTQTLEDIAMNQDPILQKAMNKWERMSQDSSFRQAYEAREKALMDEALYTKKLISNESFTEMFTPVKKDYGYGWYAESSYSAHGVMPGWNLLNSFTRNGSIYVILLSNIQNNLNLGSLNNDVYISLQNIA